MSIIIHKNSISLKALQDCESTFPADFANTKVNNKPTAKSGNIEPVRKTNPAATRTEILAMMSFLEHNHTEDIFRLSLLCLANNSKQTRLASKAINPIALITVASGVAPEEN